MTTNKSWRELFWANVNKTDKCWLWEGYLNKQGYGLYGDWSIRGRAHREIGESLAHRIAWTLLKGAIPNGLLLRHVTCNNRACVNPSHLELGTDADNALDRVKDGTTTTGSKHPMHKLSDGDIPVIRELALSFSNIDIAREFGVSPATISRVVNGKIWRHL